jgi:hypothetical protein
MFHAIKTRIARTARAITAFRLAEDNEFAARHGWTVTQVGPGTWRYRDPRFDQLMAARTAQPDGTGLTWAQDAIAGRIRVLGTQLLAGKSAAMHRKVTAALGEHREIVIVDGKSDWRSLP